MKPTLITLLLLTSLLGCKKEKKQTFVEITYWQALTIDGQPKAQGKFSAMMDEGSHKIEVNGNTVVGITITIYVNGEWRTAQTSHTGGIIYYLEL